MNILLVEPYYSGSHKYWADNLITYSRHNIILHSLPGKHWKWRMQGSAIPLSKMFKQLKETVDLIICSTMMDLALYKSLIVSNGKANSKNSLPPIIYYMHENQLTYPFSVNENRKQEDFHYGFINYKSCLVADAIIFNSHFHKNTFLASLTSLLKRLPDYNNIENRKSIEKKSEVISVGIDISVIEEAKKKHIPLERSSPTLLWNHRWDSDKNPMLFFELCYYLRSENLAFKLNLVGKPGNMNDKLYRDFVSDFKDDIIRSGYVSSYKEYLSTLCASDILPVTSDHDFYGISVMEAIISGVLPVLPRGKVYEEYISNETYSIYYYQTKKELFIKTSELIKKGIKVDNRLPDVLNNQDIRKQITVYDLYISNF